MSRNKYQTKSKGFAPDAPASPSGMGIRVMDAATVAQIRQMAADEWRDSYWQKRFVDGGAEPSDDELEMLAAKYESCRDYNTPQGYLHLAQWGLVADCGLEEMQRSIAEYLKQPVEQRRAVPTVVNELGGKPIAILGKESERSTQIKSGNVDREKRTVDLTASSEMPVERGYWSPYFEVLGHDPGEPNLDRLKDGAALLFNHEWSDQRGVIEDAQLKNRVLSVRARLSRNPKGEELLNDIEDKIVRNVSIGYITNEAILVKKSDQGDTYRVIDWEVLEVSCAPVPADPSVGIGRSEKKELIVVREQPRPMAVETEERTDSTNARQLEEIRQAEITRQSTIRQFADRYNIPSDKVNDLVGRGVEVADAIRQMMDMPESTVIRAMPTVDLNEKEQRQYSISKVLEAVSRGDTRSLGFEREIHDEICQKSKLTSNGILVPDFYHMNRQSRLEREMDRIKMAGQQRIQLVGTPASGGNIVPTDQYTPEQYIDMLRPVPMMERLGFRQLEGLVGSYKFPRKTGAGDVAPATENNPYTEFTLTFDTVGIAPLKMGALYRYTKEMMDGNPSIEALIYQDIAETMAIKMDMLAWYGNGTTEPLGLFNTPNINSVPTALGANGRAITWDDLVDMPTVCNVLNALSMSARFVSNASVMGKLQKTLKGANTGAIYLMDAGFTPNGFATLAGYEFGWTNTIRSNRTIGTTTNASDIAFGNWGEILNCVWWGMEVEKATQSGTDFEKDVELIKVSRRMNFFNRYPRAFTVMAGVVTT